MRIKIYSRILLLVVIGFSFYPALPDNEENKTVKNEYHENGRLKCSTPFINGKKEGIRRSQTSLVLAQ